VRCSDDCGVICQACSTAARVRDCDCDETLGAVGFDLPHDGGGESLRVVWCGRERELSRFCSLYRGMVDEVGRRVQRAEGVK
jgi:hypothetical protein